MWYEALLRKYPCNTMAGQCLCFRCADGNCEAFEAVDFANDAIPRKNRPDASGRSGIDQVTRSQMIKTGEMAD